MTANQETRHCQRVERFLSKFDPTTLRSLNTLAEGFSAGPDSPRITVTVESMPGAGRNVCALDTHLLLRSETSSRFESRVNSIWVTPDGQMSAGYLQGLNPIDDEEAHEDKSFDADIVEAVLSLKASPQRLRTMLRSAR